MAPSRFRILTVLPAHSVSLHRYRFCPSPTRRILTIGAWRREADLSPAAFSRQSEARNPVNECNAGTSAISFRTASTTRSNSNSLITRSSAPGRHSVARTVRGTALSTDRHASLLFEGSPAVASMAKKGRNRERPDRTLRNRWPPVTRGRRPLARLARCVLDSATNQEGLHAGRQ